MSANDDNLERLRPCSWADLLRRKHREMLVDDLLFTTGVTTLVAPSGEGKTTFAMSVAPAVDLGMWGNKQIKRRPVVWIAGEGQDDLKPMYQAIMQQTHNRPNPEGFYLEEPVDLSSDTETNKLIKLLEGMPPALIIPDALADSIGNLDENNTKDMNHAYRNIWRTVHANKGCFLVPHHTGWEEKRERGSHTIRAKSDIVAQIVSFNPDTHVAELKHNKRRGGAKLKQFFFNINLVTVPNYLEAIPIVTGPTSYLPHNVPETEQHATKLVQLIIQYFPNGLTNSNLQQQSQLTPSTFYRALRYAKNEKWLVTTGNGRGQLYNLNPNKSWQNSLSPSLPTSTPYRGVEVIGSYEGPSMEANWKSVGSDTNAEGCKNTDTTSSNKNLNENNKTESSSGLGEIDLAAEALEHLAVKKRGLAR